MADPSGALLWLGQQIAAYGVNRLLDHVRDQRQPAARRQDLSVAGGVPTSDVDVVVRHDQPWRGSPVILTFQPIDDNSGGITFPMALGDPAYLTLRRGHYLVTALVLYLPRQLGAMPTLRGLGWTQAWVADNHTKRIVVHTRWPTQELVNRLGLYRPDGAPVFLLEEPPRRALTASGSYGCRAEATRGDGRCWRPPGTAGLCWTHRLRVRLGKTVYDYIHGTVIRRTW
ncbi:MAG: hypothetical protein HOY78_29440 [Saccharothrix sp.]|nr:hypothetical protein [Saccharothrix sp.]